MGTPDHSEMRERRERERAREREREWEREKEREKERKRVRVREKKVYRDKECLEKNVKRDWRVRESEKERERGRKRERKRGRERVREHSILSPGFLSLSPVPFFLPHYSDVFRSFMVTNWWAFFAYVIHMSGINIRIRKKNLFYKRSVLGN